VRDTSSVSRQTAVRFRTRGDHGHTSLAHEQASKARVDNPSHWCRCPVMGSVDHQCAMCNIICMASVHACSGPVVHRCKRTTPNPLVPPSPPARSSVYGVCHTQLSAVVPCAWRPASSASNGVRASRPLHAIMEPRAELSGSIMHENGPDWHEFSPPQAK
jgi:hypothetical protein